MDLPMLIARYRPLIRQFTVFFGVGLTAAAGHFATLALLVEAAGFGPVLASACGFLVGGTISYTLNRRFTFDATRSHAGAVPRFAVVAGTAFVLNAVFMDVLVHRLGVFYLLAQAITIGLTMVFTFTSYRFWAFAHRDETETPAR